MASIVADRLRGIWAKPDTPIGALASVDHKQIAVRFILTSFVFFFAGGIQALLLRTQLARPGNEVLSPEAYNQVFTMHGTTMIFLFATPLLAGLGNYLVPLMIGTRQMAYPRLNAFSYWVFLFSGIFIYSSFLIGRAPDGGWFAYVPLTSREFSPGPNIDFWALGIIFLGISTTTEAVNFIATILKLRAPGMAVQRVPLLMWGVLDMGFTILFAVPSLTVAAVLLVLDRNLGTRFYDPNAGGNPLLWQHLFWLWGHPEVYILLLPSLGIVSSVVASFARRPIATYGLVVLASVAIGALSFSLWVHHMFTVGLPLLPLSFFSAASLTIAIPSGISIFAWLATLARGKLVWKTPLLFSVGFIVTFVIGGITGVMVAIVPFDWQVHDSYFVVAHFHYVLVGGVVFPIIAGLYYWFPKITGRLYKESWGQVSFWLIVAGFNVAFFPQHILGLLGMPRRVSTYLPNLGWDSYNLVSTLGAYVLAAGMATTFINLAWSLVRGSRAGSDPWRAGTLEWATSSPPPPYNFERIPVVHSRLPLWDRQESRTSSDPNWVEDPLIEGRAAIATSVLDAKPEAVIQLSGDSFSPLVAASGLAIAFSGFLVGSVILIMSGGLVAAASVAIWLWRPSPTRAWRERSASVGPAALQPSGLGRWGMALFLATEAVLFGALFSSYFMVRAQSGEWPPSGIEPPELRIPMVVTAILAAANGTMYLADRGEIRGNLRWMRLGLVVAIGAGLGFLFLQVSEAARQPFHVGTNAYGSAFFTIVAAHGAHLALAVLMSGWSLARSWSVSPDGECPLGLRNVALYWHFVGLVWLAVFAVLFVGVRWM